MKADAIGGFDGALGRELSAAVRRRPAREASLAGQARHLAALPGIRAAAVEAALALVKRGAWDRPLTGALVRALGPSPEGEPVLLAALQRDDHGGYAALAAAGESRAPRVAEALGRAAAGRHLGYAWSAELARVLRRESGGARLDTVTARVNEQQRLELFAEVLVPLRLSGAPLPPELASALELLRRSERHLGRWLVVAELGLRAGDQAPRDEALAQAAAGPPSARSAWALAALILGADPASVGGAEPASGRVGPVRPTVEAALRLSDRPSAERDPAFVFRLAELGHPGARPLLEFHLRPGLDDPGALRAAAPLAAQHGRADLGEQIRRAAQGERRSRHRGLCCALLSDLGERPLALALAAPLELGRDRTSAAWARWTRECAARPVVDEQSYRRLQREIAV